MDSHFGGVVLLVVAISAAGAHSIARGDAQQARQAFDSSSADIALTMKTLILRKPGRATSASAFR